MKEEVPPMLAEAHDDNMKKLAEEAADNEPVDPRIALANSGIASTALEKDEKMETADSTPQDETAESLANEKVQTASSSALAAAAVKAKVAPLLLTQVIGSIWRRWRSARSSWRSWMKKLEMKLKHFDEL